MKREMQQGRFYCWLLTVALCSFRKITLSWIRRKEHLWNFVYCRQLTFTVMCHMNSHLACPRRATWPALLTLFHYITLTTFAELHEIWATLCLVRPVPDVSPVLDPNTARSTSFWESIIKQKLVTEIIKFIPRKSMGRRHWPANNGPCVTPCWQIQNVFSFQLHQINMLLRKWTLNYLSRNMAPTFYYSD